MRNVLIIPHLQVQNANALSSHITIGFPALTAWLGAVHALQRKIKGVIDPFEFAQTAVVCHKMDLHTYKGPGDYNYSIIGTANPIVPKKKKEKGTPWNQFEKPPFIEEARCDLDASLLIEINFSAGDEDQLITQIIHHLNSTMKIAGGDILTFQSPQIFKIKEDGDYNYRQMLRSLMPGHVIIERRDLIKKEMEQGRDALDAMIDYLAVHSTCKQDENGIATWTNRRKLPHHIVPIATGFQGISELGFAENQRDPRTQHCFAESMVTLGEFRMLHRIHSLDEIFWSYRVKNNHYLCQINS